LAGHTTSRIIRVLIAGQGDQLGWEIATIPSNQSITARVKSQQAAAGKVKNAKNSGIRHECIENQPL
jgi:hypothetical protein